MSAKKNGKKPQQPAERQSKGNGKAVEKLRYQRPQDWRGPLIHQEGLLSTVKVSGWEADETHEGPERTQPLWNVDLQVTHSIKAESVYFGKKSALPERIVSGTDPVTLKVNVGRIRGGEKREDESFTINCELAHLDILQQALTAALAIGRRDGALPIAKGVKPIRSYGRVSA